MKNLIKGIWEAPMSTIAAAIIAGIGIVLKTGTDVDNSILLGLAVVAAFLAALSGASKSKEEE